MLSCKNELFFVLATAAERDYLPPITFLKRLERKRCNIAFPLPSVLRLRFCMAALVTDGVRGVEGIRYRRIGR